MHYQWEWKPVEEEDRCDYWKPCDSEKFPGSDTSTVTIPNVQKTNEGSYRCVITNYADGQTSKPAKLSIGKDSELNFIDFVKSSVLTSWISTL